MALAISVAAAFSIYLTRHGYSLTRSIAAGVLVYFAIRWLIAWIFRIRYWYRRGTRGVYTQSCANCGQYIYRKGGDWVLTCHRCGWKAGFPITRWFTKSVPSIQLRRTVKGPQLVVVAVVIAITVAGLPVVPEDANGLQNTSSSAAEEESSVFNQTEVERYVWQFTNQKRLENGLNRLEYAPRIVDSARNHAHNMAKNGYVGHTQPNGQTMEQRYSGECRYPGENAFGAWYEKNFEAWRTGEMKYVTTEQELARYLVNGWMRSEGHRENILNPRWKELGVGVYKRDDGKVFAAQTFC
jgi:uncharacterized protein YkwD